LTWTPIIGATQYRVVESTAAYASPVQASNVSTANVPGIRFPFPDDPLRFGARHFASGDLYYGYTITAFAPDSSAVCITTFALQIHPDDATREFFHRVVVPVAGSVTAADGSKFHTSLRLFITGPGATASGKVVFHPQGLIGTNDPSIPYNIESLPDFNRQGAVQYWDDVVAAMGASGLGTIDVIPDSGNTPEIDARAWNDIHGLVNGVPADSAGALMDGAPTEDGQQVNLIVSFPPGSFDSAAFVYYTITDNTSNDPRVFVPGKTSDILIDLTNPVAY
jgi:hypothetical protein